MSPCHTRLAYTVDVSQGAEAYHLFIKDINSGEGLQSGVKLLLPSAV